MFTECRDAIKECLELVTGRKAYTSRKKLRLSNESRVIAVLFEEDDLEKDGSKRIYTDASGKHKRRQKYKRKLSFNAVIGEYTIEEVEKIYDKFLENLPTGIYVDGNYVSIDPEGADWLDDEDSIIKARCAVQVKIVCDGGVYADTDYKAVSDVNVTAGKG